MEEWKICGLFGWAVMELSRGERGGIGSDGATLLYFALSYRSCGLVTGWGGRSWVIMMDGWMVGVRVGVAALSTYPQ